MRHDGAGRGESYVGAGSWRRSDTALLGTIILAAFGLRLVYVSQMRHSPLFDAPIMDAKIHDEWARAIVGGEAYVEGPYFRAPLYPFFLAGIYRLCGESPLAPRIIQSLTGAISCGIVCVIGRLVFRRAVGLLAGFGAAGWWTLVHYDNELLLPVLEVFTILPAIGVLLFAVRRGRWPGFAAAGALLGLAALVRPNIVLFTAAVVIWVFISYRPRWGRAALLSGVLVVANVAVIAPVTVRNVMRGGDLVLISSQGGVNFWIGNNPRSDGMAAIVPGTPADWWGGYRASIEAAERDLGRDLRPSEVSRYYFGKALAFMAEEPARAAALMLKKLALFWNGYEIPNNQDLHFWTERFGPMVRWLPLRFGWVGPLGLLGLMLCLRRGTLFPLWGFVLVYMVSVVLFFCNSRFRIPVIPPLLVLAAFAVTWLWEAIRGRRLRALSGGIVVLVLGGVVVNWPMITGEDRQIFAAQSHQVLAEAYRQRGEYDRAVDEYRRVLDIEPDFLSARYGLGLALGESGRLDRAIEQLRAGLAVAPRLERGETEALVVATHYSLGRALVLAGEDAVAAPHFEAALRRQPDHADARFELAGVLAREGRLAEATEHYRHLLDADPDHAEAALNLAAVLSERGDQGAAMGVLRELVARRPARPEPYERLAGALLASGSLDEARMVLEAGLESCPEHTGMALHLAMLLAGDGAATLSERQQSVTLAEWAVAAMEEADVFALRVLATTYASVGRHEEAVRTARAAADLARAAGQDDVAAADEELAARSEAARRSTAPPAEGP